MAVCCGLASSAYAGLVAYNDSIYPTTGGYQPTINYYSGGPDDDTSFDFNFDGESGPLRDYTTGLPSSVIVTYVVNGPGKLWRDHYGGADPVTGTPAHDVFGSILGLDPKGVFTYHTSSSGWVLTAFEGLNTDSTYELVVYAGRSGDSTYANRNVRFEIRYDGGCMNTNPAGPLVTVIDDHNTRMNSGQNGAGTYGDIASWIVTPDANGSFQLVGWSEYKGYQQQVFRLTEIPPVPEPAGLGLIRLALLAVRRRRT